MNERKKHRRLPQVGGKDIKSTGSASMSSPYCTLVLSKRQTLFGRFLAAVAPLTPLPYGPAPARALARALADLVADAASAGDLLTLRAIRDVAAPANPIAFEPYSGSGVDRPAFAQALARRLAWGRGEAARLAPSVAADDALYQATGEGWSSR